MKQVKHPEKSASTRFYFILLTAALAVWAFFQSQTIMNADNIWLSEALRRYLFEGLTASEGWYEPNPPLVIFMNTFPVLLKEYTGLPLHYSVFYQSVLIAFLAAGAIWSLISRWSFLSRHDCLVLTGSFLIAATIVAGNMTGERDHWVAMGLVPLTLIQISLTFRLPRPGTKTLLAILVPCALALMLKPHHGLLPAILIVHRLLRERRLPDFRDLDLIALTLIAISYALAAGLLFPDYISDILPVVLQGYIPQRDNSAILLMLVQYLPACALIALLYRRTAMEREKRLLGLFLIMAAIFSLIPFAVQGKGYAYHLLPANCFLWMALGFWLWACFKNQIKSGNAALVITLIFVTSCALALYLPYRDKPTHESYRALPLVRMAASCSSPPCNVFIFTLDLETTQRITYYANARLASRFPSYWPLPPVLLAEAQNPDQPAPPYRKELADMTAADLTRYEPHIVMIARLDILDNSQAYFDFPAYFADASQEFTREWQNYTKAETISVPYAAYQPGTLHNKELTLTYDLYRRLP